LEELSGDPSNVLNEMPLRKLVYETVLSREEAAMAVTINIPHCDYRSQECSTIGISVAGKWICRNHVEATLAEKDKQVAALHKLCQHHEKIEADMMKNWGDLLARAVSIAQMATSFPVEQYPVMVKEALALLDTPEVQAYQAQQGSGNE
jgi:hypothetical protein